jgi:hypothetical protein
VAGVAAIAAHPPGPPPVTGRDLGVARERDGRRAKETNARPAGMSTSRVSACNNGNSEYWWASAQVA